MGNFGGHALPGIIFIVFAFLWLIDTLNSYFRRNINNLQFRSRLVRYVVCCQGGRKVALSAWIVIVFTILGLIVELIIGPALHEIPMSINKPQMQHATMYFFFLLIGLQTLVLDRCAPNLQRRQMEYTSTAIAFLAEGILFKFHLSGRIDLEYIVHILLVYVLFATVFVLICEFWFEHSFGFAVARSYLTMLQGTWFLQIAFILYNPLKDPWGKHMDNLNAQWGEQMSLVITAIFTWHMAVIFIVYAILVLVWHKRCGPAIPCEADPVTSFTNNDQITHAFLQQGDTETLLTDDYSL